MPLVTVCPTPNGFPIARMISPTSTLSEIHKFQVRERCSSRVNSQYREVRPFIDQHDDGIELAAVRQRHGHLIGSGDNVIVGHDVTVRSYDYTRTEGVLNPLARGARRHHVAEKAAKERIVEERGAKDAPHNLARIYVDDCRSRLTYEWCVAELKLGLRRGDDPFRGRRLRRHERSEGDQGGANPSGREIRMCPLHLTRQRRRGDHIRDHG